MSGSTNRIPEDMRRIQQILHHPEFKKSMENIKVLESDRIFCRHGIEHLLDVSRIAYIQNLELDYGYRKDVVYAAGLLHDVGKYLQYLQGEPHHVTSAILSEDILKDSGYSMEECSEICDAIFTHRDEQKSKNTKLGSLIYRADKLSRACYICSASEECNWSEEKKTPGVIL